MAENTTELYKRVGVVESALKEVRGELSTIHSAVSSIVTKIDIYSAQLGKATDKPTPWPTVVTGVGLIITIGALALSPVLWLSVANFQKNMEQDSSRIETAEHYGALRSEVDVLKEQQLELARRIWMAEREK